MADNEKLEMVEQDIEQPTNEQDSPPEPKKEDVDITKIVSERINKEREKIRREALDEQAQSLGYTDHADFLKNMHNQKIIETGLDPDEIKPLLKDLLENDPEYKEALRYKREKEQADKVSWANQEVLNLNKKYGTSFASIDDLSPEVIKLWNSGVSLEKAYAAENIDEITRLAVKKSTITGKEHINNPQSQKGANSNQERPLTQDEINMFRRINPNLTIEEIKTRINKK